MDITVSLQIKIHLWENSISSYTGLRIKKKGERGFSCPLEDRIEFDGKKVYQEDISVISAELATKLTYRDAVKEGKQFIKEEERCRGIQIL
ncbi:MAG: hypothetical protein J7K81_01725 [Methanophagales archaeon]|nr:hypothetical protein [Methanophagales archaeon]